jgi:hypothetical protein
MIDELYDNEPTPAYLETVKRAAKVRSWLAKHPCSSYAQIVANLAPMKCPMKWLLQKGYIKAYRFEGRIVYDAKPMGVYNQPVSYDFIPDKDSDEDEVALAAKAMGERREYEI